MSPCKPGRHLQGLIFIGMDSDRTAAPRGVINAIFQRNVRSAVSCRAAMAL